MTHPYQGQPDTAFWRSAVARAQWDFLPGLFVPKFNITPSCRIATAGSCFAQHISRHLHQNGYTLIDTEPPPPGLPVGRRGHYGYGIFSARFGNIYTARHLLQLAREAISPRRDHASVWTRDGRFFDAMRPTVEPDGLDSVEEVLAHREQHLKRVKQLLVDMDVFIFTFGLTEAWEDTETGWVYPSAPGVIAGEFDAQKYRFRNFECDDVVADFEAFIAIVSELRREAGRSEVRYILTVSPVPLIATASASHVLAATMRSKSTLRSAAGALAGRHGNIDYFPSFELIANPWSPASYFADNKRDVTPEGVALVMHHFFQAHGVHAPAAADAAAPDQQRDDELFCDEVILEALRA